MDDRKKMASIDFKFGRKGEPFKIRLEVVEIEAAKADANGGSSFVDMLTWQTPTSRPTRTTVAAYTVSTLSAILKAQQSSGGSIAYVNDGLSDVVDDALALSDMDFFVRSGGLQAGTVRRSIEQLPCITVTFNEGQTAPIW